jgi:hypothetical protein
MSIAILVALMLAFCGADDPRPILIGLVATAPAGASLIHACSKPEFGVRARPGDPVRPGPIACGSGQLPGVQSQAEWSS